MKTDVSLPFYSPKFKPAFLSYRYWPTWLAVALLRGSVFLPRRIVGFFGACLGDFMYYVNNKRRHIVRVNIDLCFPEMAVAERRKMVRDHFRVYVQSMLDYSLLWWARTAYLDRYIKINGLEHYRAYAQQDRPIIVLTGHFVALEMGGAMLSRHFPQIGLIKPAKNMVINWLISRGRTRFNGRLFLREQGMRPVMRAIKNGYGFYYLPDEDHGPEKSIFIPFLGTQGATIPAAAKLIKICNAVALPCYVHRLPKAKGYEVVLKPALENFPTGDSYQDTLRITQELEKNIGKEPEQYMWTFKLFKTQANGCSSPYDVTLHGK